MTTALIRTTEHSPHNDPRHVEQAARLETIEQTITESGLFGRAHVVEASAASDRLIRAVHSPRVLETIQYISNEGEAWLDSDTYVTFGSWEAAATAAGAAVAAVDMVANGHADNAFALTRPPGHHATPDRSMGFCLLNNVAIAARYAVDVLGMERVAIVDYDVHHGNGTQDCFYSDSRVLFCSSHGVPLYPGTGDIREMGAGPGLGATLNAPLPYGIGDIGFERLYRQVIIPALRRFRPQLLLVSAGFDAHWDDPIGPLTLSVDGYAMLTQQLKDAAAELCDGRIALVLEGGYSLRVLGACANAALGVLMGEPQDDLIGPAENMEPDITNLIRKLRSEHPLLLP